MIIGGYPVCETCPGWPRCTLANVDRRRRRGACTLPEPEAKP